MKKAFQALLLTSILTLGVLGAPSIAYAEETADTTTEADAAAIQDDQEAPEVSLTDSEENAQNRLMTSSSDSERYCKKVSNPYSFFKQYKDWRAYQTVKDQYYLSCVSSPASSSSDPLAWNGYRNGAVHPKDLVFVDNAVLRSDAAAAYAQMNAAYKAETGKDLQVNASYRSYSRQVTTWVKDTPIAAYPGTSGHGWGTSLDLATAGDYSDQGTWLAANSEKYGWINPPWAHDGVPPEESWHFDFQTPSTPVICETIFQKKQECNQL